MRPTPSRISQLKRYRVLRGPSQNRAAAADKRFGVALPESVMNLWAAEKAGPGLAYVYVYFNSRIRGPVSRLSSKVGRRRSRSLTIDKHTCRGHAQQTTFQNTQKKIHGTHACCLGRYHYIAVCSILATVLRDVFYNIFFEQLFRR